MSVYLRAVRELTGIGYLVPLRHAPLTLCLLRLRRKLLRSSTRMRLPILNSVRAWARLFHVSASRGLRPITAEPQSAQGGLWNKFKNLYCLLYIQCISRASMQSSRWWAKICHFGEVGRWSRSLAALRCELRRTFVVRNASSTITFTQDT